MEYVNLDLENLKFSWYMKKRETLSLLFAFEQRSENFTITASLATF